ncbi:unnamed protein product [Chironomus riparius]|uniref:Ionotropic receptor n=1 Tax=Chironomus riparius TaxID=315576 RepID=A0A9N9WXY1_9DIPT|nr:unnamed protein product [Chironomus riparius]
MSLIKIIIFISCAALSVCSSSDIYLEINLISSAITEICEEYFMKKSINFDIIVFGNSTARVSKIIDQFLGQIEGKALLNIEYVQNLDTWHYRLKNSALIFFSQSNDIWMFSRNSRMSNLFRKRFKFLMYFDKFHRFDPIMTKNQDDVTNVLSHQYYIVNNNEVIQFYTFEYFEVDACNMPTKVILNVYDKITQNWNQKLENHKKFTNFNKCPLIVAENYGPFLYFNKNNEDLLNCIRRRTRNCFALLTHFTRTRKVQGFTYDIFEIAQKIANFSTIFRFESEKHRIQQVDDFPVVKIFMGSVIKMYNYEVSPTVYSLSGYFVFAVTPGEFYTNYEKLLLPFDDVTWILLLLTFVLAFSVIFVVKLMPKVVKTLLFGHQALHPALNILQIFFGVAQFRLPKDSVPRFILMLFIGFCLIFRTCYQSKIFEFMTSDMRKPPPKDVKDLIKNNFTIKSCNEGHEMVLNDILLTSDERKFIKIFDNCQDYAHTYCNYLDKVRAKFAFFMEDTQFSTFNALCHGSAVKLKHFKKDTTLIALLMLRNSFLTEIINDILEKTIPFGIPQYLMDFHHLMLFKHYEKVIVKVPKVLKVDDLGFGFEADKNCYWSMDGAEDPIYEIENCCVMKKLTI